MLGKVRGSTRVPAAVLAAGLVAAVAGGCTADQPQSAPSAGGSTTAVQPTAADTAAPSERQTTRRTEPVQSTPTAPPPEEPTAPPPEEPTDRAVTVTVVGDIMLGRSVADVARAAGGPSAPLRPMAAQLARADVTVGNLESTLSTAGARRQGDDSFAAPPAVLRGLRAAGFDVLSLANNHTGDYGRRALLQTVRRVGAAGIAPLGAGRDRASAWRPVVIERRGVRVGFLAFNAIGETWRARPDSSGAASLHMAPRTGPLVPSELSRVADRVRALAARTDVVLVLPHWGDQYTHQPVPDQRRVGRALIDAGASVVVGGHPHWVQDVQRHRGRFVVHSLGNFVFDMDFMTETQQGVVLDLTFRVGDLVRTRATPYVIGDGYAPRPVGGATGREIRSDIGGLALLPR